MEALAVAQHVLGERIDVLESEAFPVGAERLALRAQHRGVARGRAARRPAQSAATRSMTFIRLPMPYSERNTGLVSRPSVADERVRVCGVCGVAG